jgi:hypothetical protein
MVLNVYLPVAFFPLRFDTFLFSQASFPATFLASPFPSRQKTTPKPGHFFIDGLA